MKYEVNIIDKPFIENEIKRNKTTVVSFYKEDGTVEIKEYGFIETPEIEQQILSGNDINLDYCYVENFILGDCKLIKSLSARYAFYGGAADFTGAQFSGNADFSEVGFLGHVYFMNSTCKALILTDCIIEKTFDLSNTQFDELSLMNLKILGFIHLEWNENIRYSINKYVMIKSNEVVVSLTPYMDKAKQFRFLKENFRRIGQYDDEDKAYVEFKRYEAKSKFKCEEETRLFNKIFNKLFFPFKWLIADFIGEYGTNPMRILASLVLSIIFFGAVYYLCGAGIENFGIGLGILQKIGTSLYYSAITSFTVGYGDISPTKFGAHQGLVEALSCFEAFFGLFLMAYFTVAFSRKVLR